MKKRTPRMSKPNASKVPDHAKEKAKKERNAARREEKVKVKAKEKERERKTRRTRRRTRRKRRRKLLLLLSQPPKIFLRVQPRRKLKHWKLRRLNNRRPRIRLKRRNWKKN